MYRLYYILFFVMAVTVGCDKDFEEINTNPNAPNAVQPELLLRQIIYNYGEEMSYEGFVAGNLLAQHFTMVDFNLFDRHSLSDPQLGGNPWPIFYRNLRDNEILLNQVQEIESQKVYRGPAYILKAYMTAALTDIYGDVPYSEALLGASGEVTPKYDEQSDIYLGEQGILANLDRGIADLLEYTGAQPLKGDLLFGGNLTKWIAMARSLKIKYLMRISDRVDVGAELQSIYNSGTYIKANENNATFDFAAGRPNSFRMQQLRDGDFNLFILSETMESILSNLQDPRLQVLFRPTGNDPSQFIGLINGIDASQTSISVANYSLTGKIFREQTDLLDANFMTAWETQFLLAEAAERGFITADAQVLYESAVDLAFDYWKTPLPAEYLTTGPAAYGLNGVNVIEQIITQKWIANSINGYEGWIEYRRTGYPRLQALQASLNNNIIPSRMPYPADEQALNQENYEAAIGTDGNDINLNVWWDVN